MERASHSGLGVWGLKFGIFLELGIWCLELCQSTDDIEEAMGVIAICSAKTLLNTTVAFPGTMRILHSVLDKLVYFKAWKIFS